MSTRFVFEHLWRLQAPSEHVFAALADIRAYPQWWPQVRSIRPDEASDAAGAAGADRVRARVRSLLPYSLRVALTRTIEDADTGCLRVELSEDLRGSITIRIAPAVGGSTAHFVQDCELTVPWMRCLEFALSGAMRANHTWMMRAGRDGLAAHLAGYSGDVRSRRRT